MIKRSGIQIKVNPNLPKLRGKCNYLTGEVLVISM